MCGRDVSKEKCPVKCDKTMDCEHICALNCHETIPHDQVKCSQSCRRTPCPEKHPCPKKCFEDCGDCLVEVVKTLTCGHEVSFFVNFVDYFIYLILFILCRIL